MAVRPVAAVILRRNVPFYSSSQAFCTTAPTLKDQASDFKLLIIGAGTGGTAAANMFTSKFGANNVAVLDDAQTHWYQPGFTMVGGGIKNMQEIQRATKSLLPNGTVLIKDTASSLQPDKNTVVTSNGQTLTYQYLIVAAGIQLRYDKIEGAEEALKNRPEVASNYSPAYVVKTYPAFEKIKDGNAIFTFPAAPIKCAGAPQKICYLFDDYCRRNGKRDSVDILYNTALPKMFGVAHYAGPLLELVKKRGITPNFKHNLVKVLGSEQTAVFDLLDENNKAIGQKSYQYNFLHIAPPCSPHKFLREAPTDFVDAAGFVTVDKETLQHLKYPNVFAVGDCSNAPTAKTAAAISAQSGVVKKNLNALVAKKTLTGKYDGYTSCPLVTSNKTCILAEFDYNLEPLETTPLDQRKERWTSFFMKNKMMPFLYWHGLVTGLWRGPRWVRKAMHLGMGK